MSFNTRTKLAKYGYIIISIIIALFSISLIIYPNVSLNILTLISGIILILFGIVKIVGYFSKDLYRLAFQFDLAIGIAIILVGLILIVKPEMILIIILSLIGIFVMIDSLLKIQIALDAKEFGIKRWINILIIALISALFGYLLLFKFDESLIFAIRLLGVALLFDSTLNLLTIIMTVKLYDN